MAPAAHGEWALNARGDDEGAARGIDLPKRCDGIRSGVVGVVLTLECVQATSGPSGDEIELAVRLVPPIEEAGIVHETSQSVKDQVLPELPPVVRPDLRPALFEANEARIESVALRPRHDFPSSPSVERPQHVYRVGDLHRLEVRPNCRETHSAVSCQSIQLELTSALPHEQAKQELKAPPAAEAKQLFDVSVVVAVGPLVVEVKGRSPREQCLGQPAMQEPAVDVGSPDPVRALLPQDRLRVDGILAPCQRIAELPGCGQRR